MTTTTHAPTVFNFNSNEVRTILRNNEPWFVAADVCKALTIANPSTALNSLDDDEQALTTMEGLSRGNNQANIINESGLYSLILRSRKPEAKAFKRWVTSEVLPSIRKTGGYQSSEPTEGRLTPAEYEELLVKRGKVIVDKDTSKHQPLAIEHHPLVGASALLIRLGKEGRYGDVELVPEGSTIVDRRDPISVARFVNSICCNPDTFHAAYKEIQKMASTVIDQTVKTHGSNWQPKQLGASA